MASPIIRTNNVAVVYGEGSAKLRALDGVSIEIFPEEYIIFFGPSGCGKSTLLYTIAGLEAASEGSVIVQEKDIAQFSREQKVGYHRNTIGMVFQAYYLITSLSVLQNVALPQIFASKDSSARETRAKSLLKRFGILEQAEKLPNSLSGGQQQRVAIARSLANDAPIILADEPVGNLDSKSADVVLELLKDLNKTDKKTVIMVTHNPSHLHYADRVFYMKDGKVIREVRNENVKPEVKKEEPIPLMNFGLQEYAKQFPHLSEEELKAKMLTSYVLGEIDIETEEKLEHLVGEYMRRQITDEQFIHKVTRPIKSDGLGLYHAFAERLLRDLKRVLEMADFLVKEYGTYPKTYESYDAILTKLAGYLYAATEHQPSPENVERVKKVLKSRLEGSLDHDGFRDFLDKPEKNGGAGLNIRTARNFARQFELVLLGFEERARKHKEDAPDKKPHLFGMGAHVITSQKPQTASEVPPKNIISQHSSEPKPSDALPRMPMHAQSSKQAPSPNTSSVPTKEPPVATPHNTSGSPVPTPLAKTPAAHAQIIPPPAPTQKLPLTSPSKTSEHAGSVRESITFFDGETKKDDSSQKPQPPSKTASVQHSGFLATLTHMLRRERHSTSTPALKIAEPIRSESPAPSLQGLSAASATPTVKAPLSTTSAPVTPPSIPAQAPSIAAPKAPHPQPPVAPSAPKPPVPEAAPITNDVIRAQIPTTPQQTSSGKAYHAPMIFPQKLHSFTKENHESH